MSPTTTPMENADFLAYVKQEGQKADNAKVPTHLWSFFLCESFLLYFDTYRGTKIEWKRDHPNIYRRHSWRKRVGVPKGWERALDGFRRLGIRWWRRRLLRTYVKWKRSPITTAASREILVNASPEGTYVWERTRHNNIGQSKYRQQH